MSKRKRGLLLTAAAVIMCAGAAKADEINIWNDLWLDAVRTNPTPPTEISRKGAMLTSAMYDAYMNIAKTHQHCIVKAPASSTASKDAAMAVAAHGVLSHLYPAKSGVFDAQLAASLAGIAPGASKNEGMALGGIVAAGVIANRANDNSDLPTDYTHGTNPGDYQPTWPDFNPSPYTPRWGEVTPWALPSGSQFRPNGIGGYTDMPSFLASDLYTQNFNEVKELGGVNSATRTVDQTRMGFFWANDVNGTYKPPGHLNNITREVADQQGLSQGERVRLLALVHLAMADAGIAAWDAKYGIGMDLWRPITGIQQADTDGNPNTIADPDWEPLNGFSPPFPAWVSGHATFGAAHAAIMAAFFGTDNISFSITSEDPFYAALFPPGEVEPRHFDSFTQAAIENWRSRVYIGVHWDIDGYEGFMLGQQVGNYIFDTMLLVPAPGAATMFALGGLFVVRRRRSA